MKRFNFLRLLLVAVSSLLIFSCDKKDLGNLQDPNPKTEDGNAVYVLDTQQEGKLQSVDDENGTLTFSALTSDEQFKTGDIICSAPTENAPQGFLYRVKKINTKDGKTIIETQEVSLEEAIENVDVSETLSLDDYIAGVFDEDGNPLEYSLGQNSDLRASIASQITISIGKTFESGNGSIALSGSLTLSNELEFSMSIQKWNLQYLKFACTMGTELQATVSGELKGTMPLWNVRIATIKLAPITIPAGPVPVVITPEIPIYLTGELNGSIKGEFTPFDSKNSTTVGVLYENSRVNGIFEKKSPESKSLAERTKISLSGELKTTIEPGVSFLLYNSRNASVGASVGIYGKAQLTLLDGNVAEIVENLANSRRYGINPDLKISLGAEAGVEAHLKIFGLKLLDYKASLQLYETELLRGSVFPQFTDISVSDISENSAKATTAAQTPAFLNFIVPVSQYGICVSQNSLPSIETDWHNNLGAFPTVWSAVTAPVASAELSNLQADKTYNVCVYFTNWFGTYYSNVSQFKTGDDICDGAWVLINGVKWATRNVGSPGTFVSNPENYGGYYQWNKGTTDFLLYDDYYNSIYSKSDTWLPSNDPSPAGYRVPTLSEIQSLVNTSYVTNEWKSINGVYGRKFTDKSSGNCIFLPAAGDRYYYDGQLYYVGEYGYYWSSTPDDSRHYAYYLDFGSGLAAWYWYGWDDRSNGRSVRCVAD